MNSMTQVACDHVKTHGLQSSNTIGTIMVQDDGGNMITFKRGQHLVKKHYGHWYWKEAKLHVTALGNDKYLLPTTPIV